MLTINADKCHSDHDVDGVGFARNYNIKKTNTIILMTNMDAYYWENIMQNILISSLISVLSTIRVCPLMASQIIQRQEQHQLSENNLLSTSGWMTQDVRTACWSNTFENLLHPQLSDAGLRGAVSDNYSNFPKPTI